MSIGERLRFARKELGLTQGQMATELGITLSTISDIERGKLKKISDRLVVLMHEVFGLDPDWLLFGRSSQSESPDEPLGHGGDDETVVTPMPKDIPTEYDRFPDRDILNTVIPTKPGTIPGLTELENEIMHLYLQLEPSIRQRVLTELAVSIARNSVNKNLQNTEQNKEAKKTESIFDIDEKIADSWDNEFATELKVNTQNFQYFDINGKQIVAPISEKSEILESINIKPGINTGSQ